MAWREGLCVDRRVNVPVIAEHVEDLLTERLMRRVVHDRRHVTLDLIDVQECGRWEVTSIEDVIMRELDRRRDLAEPEVEAILGTRRIVDDVHVLDAHVIHDVFGN